MRARTLLTMLLVLAPAVAGAQAARRPPTVDDLLSFRTVGGPQISPDGRRVAYTESQADFAQNANVQQIWIADVATGKRTQLTRGEKASQSPRWSPDGTRLAFTSGRAGDKPQIFLIAPDGGEAVQLTKAESGVNGFVWAPDGASIAYTSADPAPKARKERLGDYEVVRREYQFVQLYTVEVGATIDTPRVGRQRTKGSAFSVNQFSWSPDGMRLAFSAQKNPDLIQGTTADIYVLDLATDAAKAVVTLAGGDYNPVWSPDGKQLAFVTIMGRQPTFAVNQRIGVVNADGGTPRVVADKFDEHTNLLDWTPAGIWFTGQQGMWSHLFRADPATGTYQRITAPDTLIASQFSLSKDGTRAAFMTASPVAPYDVAVSDLGTFAPRLLTDAGTRAQAFTLGTRERFTWKSHDGTPIEGVLIKPADFDPSKKYPLLCVIHGGPTGIDVPVLLTSDLRTYPVDVWAARGALVLKVNYRGSAGYGEKFRMLNIRNLGVGDAWDVVSGVDALIAKGWVDPARVASMGWSQGGYISAFLTTSTTRFAAISVGAGISDWATYYYNTDITPFTINYLGADPVADPEIYRKTSPISYVKGAKTPTLIQHGELDRRVPIANGYELRQALEDRGVPVEMVVYKGFGHGITKPREQRAVMMHNLGWFNHYLFGDPAPDLTTPEPAAPVATAPERTPPADP